MRISENNLPASRSLRCMQRTQQFFHREVNVEAREEPRQSLQDGDKALESLRASRLDIHRETSVRSPALDGRHGWALCLSLEDELRARHTRRR